MSVFLDSLGHFVHQFESFFHLCFLVSVFIFVVGTVWVLLRILIPLWDLSLQLTAFTNGQPHTFERPSRGIAEVEQLRKILFQMATQLQAAQERELLYRNALVDSQENERKRIARELHDDTIQSLVLCIHNIDRVSQTIDNKRDDKESILNTTRNQILDTIDCLRRLIANLRPTVLDELGLVTAIEMLCEQNGRITFNTDGELRTINHAQELALFRSAQEAFRNAEQYAKADHIHARLVYSNASVTFEVYDDGIGFKVPCQLQELVLQGHYGLLGMFERVKYLGGEFKVQSALNTGTRITVTLPLTA